MPTYLSPGVYVEEVPSSGKPIEAVGTSIAAFVGLAPGGPINTPFRVSRWGQFAKVCGDSDEPDNGPFMEGAFLAHAVRGFFENGGTRCWVVRVGDATPRDLGGDVEERSGLVSLAAIDEVTMVCMPDAMTLAGDGDQADVTALQGKLIAHCENAGNRMAILDSPPRLSPREILDWRPSGPSYDSRNAALYYPWLEVANPLTGRPLLVPPSGHVAGVWCRTDAGYGVHRAPTEGVLGVAGLGSDVAENDQAEPRRGRRQLDAGLPGAGHPRLGRAHAFERSGVALRPRAQGLPPLGRLDRPRHTLDGLRAERRTAVGGTARTGGTLSRPQLARRRAGRRNHE
jgi:phage tail sheath protein FI